MNAAKLEKSARLQRVNKLLSDGIPRTTRQIIRQAHVCAVSSITAELRQQGKRITCYRKGKHFWHKMMVNA